MPCIVKGISVDRCGWCKHSHDFKPPGIFTCEAFPDGLPRGFREDGGECNNGLRFEVVESRREEYEQLWERKSKSIEIEPYVSEDGRISIE